jgi:proline iminopeptidase
LPTGRRVDLVRSPQAVRQTTRPTMPAEVCGVCPIWTGVMAPVGAGCAMLVAVSTTRSDEEPDEFGALPVGDGHQLYWETVGASDGTPAVYLHGGPGSGSDVAARRYFDPTTYRAVLFDQRGCGRSRPLVSDPATELSTITTDHLVADIERLREHLGIERWVVAGLSWGVTLALVYAQAHPQRVAGMALGAITAGRRREIEWITRDMRRVFPREWDAFAAVVPAEQRDGDLAAGYARALADPDPAVRYRAARAWCAWEDTHLSLMPGWTPDPRYADPGFRMVFAKMVTHFWSHGCFLIDRQIQVGMPKLAGIPAVLVHGRYDISGPLDTAWTLHRAWPGSELVIVDDAGHGGGRFPDAVTDALHRLRALV